MNAVPSQFNDKHRTGRGRAFSMTELLVVIAIIAVLAGILLVALKGVRQRALATQTRATMQEFSKACDSFQIEQGHYPGIIPEGILAANPEISGTENALLHMMGGVIRGDDPRYNDPPFDSWQEIIINDTNLGKIRVNKQLIGNGPEIMSRVEMVGTDSRVSEGMWTCGKDGQSVPVGVGMPTVKISSITVGGRSS